MADEAIESVTPVIAMVVARYCNQLLPMFNFQLINSVLASGGCDEYG